MRNLLFWVWRYDMTLSEMRRHQRLTNEMQDCHSIISFNITVNYATKMVLKNKQKDGTKK